MKSNDRIERLLGLVPYLRRHQGIPVREAAEIFGLTPKQLIGDLNTLWMCGLPGGMPGDLIEIDMDAVETEGIIHLTNADYLARPMRLRSDEAISLIVALQSLAEVATGEAAVAVGSTIAKLTELLDTKSIPVQITVNSGSSEVRSALQTAIDQGQRIRLTHHGRRRISTPLVDPVRIDLIDGNTYLWAWSLDAQDWRSYRLDRVEQVEGNGEVQTQHGTPPAWGSWLNEPNDELILRLHPAARWVSEHLPTTFIEADGEDCIVSVPVVDHSWAVSLVMRLGEDAEVVSPDAVTKEVTLEAAAALEIYRKRARLN